MYKMLNASMAERGECLDKVVGLVEDNHDLNCNIIKSILLSKQELKRGQLEPYDFLEE